MRVVEDDEWTGWLKVEKVKEPSPKPPHYSLVVLALYDKVLDKDMKALYTMLEARSIVQIYAMPNYFLAKQYMLTKDNKNYGNWTRTLVADYRLTLTDEAKRLVNELLNSQFKCDVEWHIDLDGNRNYLFSIYYPVYVPFFFSANTDIPAEWSVNLTIKEHARVERLDATLPSNCGPFLPLWEQAVECWMKEMVKVIERAKRVGEIEWPERLAARSKAEIADILEESAKWAKVKPKPTDIDFVKHKLLEYKYLESDIVPAYSI